jgi:hypothetical protein
MMSRLKTKTINIQPGGGGSGAGGGGPPEQGNAMLQNILSGMTGGGGDDDISLGASVVNLSSLGDISQESAPHKSKRRPRSEKNTVSMDL